MTGIDTVSASKHWTGKGKDERHYLVAIEYIAIADDGKNISLLGDEEGNYETLLTPLAAKYVIFRLYEALKKLEGDVSILDILKDGSAERQG